MSKDYKISYFKKASDNEPTEVSLNWWLKKTIEPPKDLLNIVAKYRKTKNEDLKQYNTPAVTISASFKKVRNLKHIKKKLPFIVIDIDRKSKSKNKHSNTCIDMQKVKDLLSKHKSTYYCGYSMSDDGIYCIIKIDPKKPLIKYFKHLKKTLRMHGIFIDESCKDYTRLRFFSVDTEAYFNPNAKTYVLPKKQKKVKHKPNKSYSGNNLDKVEAIVSLIEAHSMDITSDYNDWIKIAGALYSEFGDGGRELFHRISKFHPEYKQKKADDKFNKCQKMNKVSLSSFFYIANSYGLRY